MPFDNLILFEIIDVVLLVVSDGCLDQVTVSFSIALPLATSKYFDWVMYMYFVVLGHVDLFVCKGQKQPVPQSNNLARCPFFFV